jgi:hypothetical protein
MSQIVWEQPQFSSAADAFLLDNAFTTTINGGYFLGFGPSFQWTFEIFGSSGGLHLSGYRTEGTNSLIHINAGAQLAYSTIDAEVYRANSTTPQIEIDAGGTLSYSSIKADDFGGSTSIQPFYACPTTCSVTNNPGLFVGINQTFNTSSALQAGNQVFVTNGGQSIFSGRQVVAAGLTLGATTPITSINAFTFSATPAAVPASSCSDQVFTVTGLSTSDDTTTLRPPSAYGNVTAIALPSGANQLTIHFCNPSASSVTPPSGNYTFKAFH